MAISAEEFGRRLDQKRVATLRDLSRYERINDRQSAVRVAGQSIQMLPRGFDSVLTPAEELEADRLAPFWSNGAPVCTSAEEMLSLEDEQTGIKNQAGRSTCVAHASLAALEHLLQRGGMANSDLSERYANWLFMKFEGESPCHGWVHTKQAAIYLSKWGVCKDRWWNYTGCEGSPPGDAPLKAVYGIGSYRLIGRGLAGPRMGNTDYLECVISRGMTIVTSIDLAIGDENPTDGIYDVLKDESGNVLARLGGHAMLLVGYNRPANYFIFKNSWGDECDHEGYIWLSYDYVRKYSKYGFIVMEVDSDKPVPTELEGLNIVDLNMQLSKFDRRFYSGKLGAKIVVDLPEIPREGNNRPIVFKAKAIGSAIEQLGSELLSTGSLLLPGRFDIRTEKRGIGHLVLNAYDEERGVDIPGVKPLVITISVDDDFGDNAQEL